MAEKAQKKYHRDDPIVWSTWNDWHDAVIYAGMKGYFDLKEDSKVAAAWIKYDLKTVREATKRRLKAVGVTKPVFKKAKKLGVPATLVKGTRAYAGLLYERKIYGMPKGTKKPKPKKAVKKAEKKKIEPKPLSPPNPDLPQTQAYAIARSGIKKHEILSYIVHDRVGKKFDFYTAVYRNIRTKKKRKEEIKLKIKPRTLSPDEERRMHYAERVKEYHENNGKLKVKKAVPKKKRPSRL